MPTIERPSGVRLHISDAYREAGRAEPPVRRGAGTLRRGRPMRPISLRPQTPADDGFASGLTAQMELVDTLVLTPTVEPTRHSGTRRGLREAVPTTSPIAVEVDTAPGESAVVLVEQDGLYAWCFGQAQPDVTGARRGPEGQGGRMRFEIQMHASSSTARRRGTRGFVSDLILRPVKAMVFRFAAGIVVGQLVKRLEQDLQRGVIVIGGPDLDDWRHVDDPASVPLPAGREPRVLLLVHGTFSSTLGGFGSLAATQWGRGFLQAALRCYDAVIGFDHATLSEDPAENAEQLLEALRALSRSRPAHIDVVTHSRGALVVRALIEHLLPDSGWPGRFERVVLTAGPNAGTGLASPENWKTLVDLYTNLAVAGAKAAAMLAPPAAGIAMISGTVLDGVGRLVKALATAAVDAVQVPGLASMTPDGPFVAELNRAQPGQPATGDVRYYAITSNFETDGFSGPAELPEKLKLALADRLVDQLMGADNDLVVDVPSMTCIDVRPHEQTLAGVYAYGTNSAVYHTNYFLQPDTCAALRRWLDLGSLAAVGERDVPAAVTRGDLPAAVSEDLVRIDADMPLSEVADAVEESTRELVVVRRRDPGTGRLYHYGFRRGELLDLVVSRRSESAPLESLGVLHESESSEEVASADVSGPSMRPGGAPWSRRNVVMEDARPTAVVLHASELASAAPASAPPSVLTGRPTSSRGGPRLPADVAAPRPEPATTMRGGAGSGAPPRVTQHVRAEMAEELPAGTLAQLLVELSAETLVAAIGPAADSGTVEMEPAQLLTLTVVPRINLRVEGSAQAESEPATPGNPMTLVFEVRALEPGPAEVWVVARQGPRSLLTLKLHPRVIEAQASPSSGRRGSEARVEPGGNVAPRHQLSIYESREGDGVRFLFDFRSRDLDVTRLFQSDLIHNRERFLSNLYTEIENRWLATQADVEDFNAELRAYGADLFHELMPRELRGVLWENRGRIDSIEVVSTEPFVPWELVHLTAPDRRRLPRGEEPFLGSLGMVRWLHEAGAPPLEIRVRDGRVMGVIPDYPQGSGYHLEHTAQEFAFLEQHFAAVRATPQPGPFRRLIGRPGQFDVLHFAGHGLAEADDIANATLMLEGTTSDGSWMPNYVNASLVDGYCDLQDAEGNRPIVVLNACQVGRGGYKLSSIGGFSKAFLRGRAGMFVSSMWSVGDAPAHTFTEALYTALDGGASLANAARVARAAARDAGDATWLAYVVYGDPYMTLSRR